MITNNIPFIVGDRILLITDLLSESINTNIRLITVPANSKLENLIPHLKPPENDFKNIDVCFVAVGHNNLDTVVGQFMTLFKQLVNTLRVHKSTMFIYVVSVLPMGPHTELYKYAQVKSSQIKDVFNRKQHMCYINFYQELAVRGRIPPELIRAHRLSLLGMKVLFCVMSKVIQFEQDLQL